jgi:hypothetical protein
MLEMGPVIPFGGTRKEVTPDFLPVQRKNWET